MEELLEVGRLYASPVPHWVEAVLELSAPQHLTTRYIF